VGSDVGSMLETHDVNQKAIVIRCLTFGGNEPLTNLSAEAPKVLVDQDLLVINRLEAHAVH
jgi:hypothetical protein